MEGHYDVVQILLAHGADLDSKDADGRSTLYVLALDNRLAMSKYFIQQGADVETRDLEVRTYDAIIYYQYVNLTDFLSYLHYFHTYSLLLHCCLVKPRLI